MNSCSCVVVYLMIIIFATIVNSYQNLTIPNKNDNNNDHRRSLQSSNSFSTSITKLTASNGGPFHNFGNNNGVAISNNRIVVAAWGYNTLTGAAYVFMDPNNPETGRSYSQMAILTASDGQSGHQFGRSVDIDGDVIVVGAIFSNSGKGAVYIFRIGDNNNNISQIAKITAQNGVTNDFFGRSVAIHKNFILVGAYGAEKNDSTEVGSAYLYVNRSNDPDNHDWTQIMQFQPNDLVVNAWFGWSVAMDDRIAVVGTADEFANTAYVFAPVDSNVASSPWTQIARLAGPTYSWFGNSVAVSGSTIVVGASYDDINGINAGAIFIFTKIDGSSSSSWTQTNILLAADGTGQDYFGTSISISKDASTIVVGADYDDYSSTITDSGAAYLFRKTTVSMATGWTQAGKFVAADRASNDNLGSSIAIENSIVVVGARGDDIADRQNTGSAYVLDTGFSPTAQPSSTPSRMPSLTPSVSPSLTPSTAPSTMPSLLPSSLPSFRPSLVPVANTVNTGSGIPWNKIFPLAASGALILGFLGCLLL